MKSMSGTDTKTLERDELQRLHWGANRIELSVLLTNILYFQRWGS